jgi:NitT/TauT family transport system substrate-binding protein
MKAKSNKKNIAIGTAAIILIILIISTSLFILSNNSNQKLEPLIIGQLSTGQSELVFVAENQGFFTANGLNVTIQNYDSGAAALTGLINNETDVSISTEYPIVSQSFNKANISIIGNIDTFQNIYVIGKKSSGIENATSLIGKRIGVNQGTILEFYLGRYLNLNGINITNVTEVNIPLSQSINSLLNGTIDAFVAQDVYFSQVQQLLGSDFTSLPLQNGQTAFWLLSIRNDWISSHSDAIVGLLKSLKQAEEYVINNPDKAKTIFQNDANYTNAYTMQDWPDNSFSLSLDQSLIIALQDEAQWIINNHLTNQTQIPNFTNYIYTSGLEAVDPQSVSIIK